MRYGSAIVRIMIRGFGELLITAGLVVALFCAYELWGTGLYTARHQNQLNQQLQRRWQQDKPTVQVDNVPFGKGFAVMRIPEFGKDWDFVIVEGVGVEDLKKGPGHYPGSAMPGQVGNFVVSGHRTTYSAPFKQSAEFEAGDAIVIETANWWYVYRVTEQDVVDPSRIEVIESVPYRPGKKATKRRITITTCHPMYTAKQRLITFGLLESKQRKSAGPPQALAQG